MHDLIFVGFLAAIFAAGFRRPFLLVLVYAYIDIFTPQRHTYMLLNSVPVSMIAALLAVGGWALADDKRDARFAPRQALLLVLLVYCWATTLTADFPVEAQDKWVWVWKSLAFAAFLPLTLRTRLRMEALLLFMVLSAGTIFIVGGIKTAAGGGGYGSLNLMIDDNSGLYEGSTASTVAIAIVPVILWLMRFGTIFPPDWRVKGFGAALIFACLLIPVGTSTRTGLLCIALLGLLALRSARRKGLYVAGIAVLALVAVPFLPASFTQRMNTIQTYQADASASTRIAVWQWTLDYVKQHPFGGGFQAFRGNHIRYDLKPVPGQPAAAPAVEVDKARAYHSAYFEMLGEQGYAGLALWLLLHLAGLVRMEVLRRRYRDPEGDLAWAGSLAGALQSAHLVYLLGSVFIAIAFQPFVFMLLATQIALDTYCARHRAAAGHRPFARRLATA